jgi:hypothetical protein
VFRKNAAPDVFLDILAPCVEATAFAVGRLNERSGALVAAADYALQRRDKRVLYANLMAVRLEFAANVFKFCAGGVFVKLRRPLIRSVRFGNKGSHVDTEMPTGTLGKFQNKICDFNVLTRAVC